jgi:hypothetical protein
MNRMSSPKYLAVAGLGLAVGLAVAPCQHLLPRRFNRDGTLHAKQGVR